MRCAATSHGVQCVAPRWRYARHGREEQRQRPAGAVCAAGESPRATHALQRCVGRRRVGPPVWGRFGAQALPASTLLCRGEVCVCLCGPFTMLARGAAPCGVQSCCASGVWCLGVVDPALWRCHQTIESFYSIGRTIGKCVHAPGMRWACTPAEVYMSDRLTRHALRALLRAALAPSTGASMATCTRGTTSRPRRRWPSSV